MEVLRLLNSKQSESGKPDIRHLGDRQNGLYREGEAPADPKPSSAGASLSHPYLGQVDFSLPLALYVSQANLQSRSLRKLSRASRTGQWS